MRHKIDCHTHIINEKIKNEYFAHTDGYAVVMQFPPSIMDNPDTIATVRSDRRLFLCPAIDLKSPIPPQLDAIYPTLDENRIVGLKIYLSYQSGRADDEKLIPVYEFADKYGLTVTFHTGLCSLVLPSDNDIEGSNAKYVGAAAAMFPNVNFVAAHMDDPRLDECIAVAAEHNNFYTDYSGAYEPGYAFDADREAAAELFGGAIHTRPDMYKKILYGSDFCPPINLSELDEYERTAAHIFAPEELPDVYWDNALRAFPRIKYFIEKEGQQ